LTKSSPYKFESPWSAWDFADFVLYKHANLAIISIAWRTEEEFSRDPNSPDMTALAEWVYRLQPIILAKAEEEIIVVIANRCGMEDGTIYTGTSCVLSIRLGKVKVYDILGCGDKELLVVDTSKEPRYQLQFQLPANSISSSIQSPDRALKEWTPQRAATPLSGTKRPPVPLEQELDRIEVPEFEWFIEHKEPPPDSASSMRVHAPWESDTPAPSAIMQALTLIPQSSSNKMSILTPSIAFELLPNTLPSMLPRPQSPKGRNASQSPTARQGPVEAEH
jgi:hypothetical protein